MDAVGRRLGGRYWILREHRLGTLDVSYEGYDEAADRRVWILMFRPDLNCQSPPPPLSARLVEVLQRTAVPALLRPIESGRDGEADFLAIEWVGGRGLDEILRVRRTLTVGECLWIARSVAECLAALSRNGLSHGCLSPSRIVVGENGDVALMPPCFASPEASILASAANLLPVECLAYLSPEQLGARGEIDAGSDLHALGTIMYRALTGTLPFDAGTVPEMMMVRKRSPLPPSQLVPGVDACVDDFVLRLLARDRSESLRDAESALAEMRSLAVAPEKPLWSSAWLVHHSGAAFDVSWRSRTLVGRTDPTRGHLPDVDLCGLEGWRTISRSHAIVFQEGGGYHLLAHPAGRGATLLDGSRLAADTPLPLADGATVRMGDLSLSLVVPRRGA